MQVIGVLAVLICCTPLVFNEYVYFGVVVFKTLYFQLLVEFSFVVWVLLLLQSPQFLPSKNKLNLAVALFLVLLFVVNLFSTNRAVSFLSNMERMDGFLLYLHAGLLYFVWSSTLSVLQFKRLLIVSITVGLCVLIFGYFMAGHTESGRMTSTLGNAAYLAYYFVCMIYFSVFAVFQATTQRYKRLKWVVGLVLVLIFFGGILQTGTRAGLVTIVAGLITFNIIFIWQPNSTWQKQSLLLLSMLAIGAGFYWVIQISQDSSLNRLVNFSSDHSAATRWGLWKTAWEGFKLKPFWGWGQNNFSTIFIQYGQLPYSKSEGFYDKAHNIFFEWISATGIIGFASFFSIFLIALHSLWKNTQLPLITKALLISFLVSYWVFHFFSFDNLTSIAIVFGVLAFVSKTTEAEKIRIPLPVLFKPAVVIITIAATSFFIYQFNYKTYQTARNILVALKSTDINKTIEIAQNTYKKALIGKSDLMIAMLSMREIVATTDLTAEQKKRFFDTFLPLAMNEFKQNPYIGILPMYIAESNMFRGDTLKALLFIDDYCMKHPQSSIHWISNGLLMSDAHQYPKALEAFQNLSKNYPNNPATHVYSLYVHGQMKDTLQFLNTINQLSWEDRVLYQDQIFKAFIKADQILLYFDYIKSCTRKELLDKNSYLQWAYMALNTNNVVEYRNAWQEYTAHVRLKRKLSLLEKSELDELIGKTIQNQLSLIEAQRLIDTFGTQ